jgi:hypothetical protein
LELDESKANSLLAESCLEVILTLFEDGYWRKAPEKVLPESDVFFQIPMQEYAFHALGYHLMMTSQPSLKLVTLVKEFFRNPSLVEYFVLWLFIVEKQLPSFPAYATKLHLAAYFNIGWLIDDALTTGIDPNAMADMNDTPLIWASEMGCVEAIQKLLDAGADPNKREYDGWTALHWAAANGHFTVAKLLLQHGARKDFADDGGLFPHHVASRCGQMALAAEIHPNSNDEGKGLNTDKSQFNIHQPYEGTETSHGSESGNWRDCEGKTFS